MFWNKLFGNKSETSEYTALNFGSGIASLSRAFHYEKNNIDYAIVPFGDSVEALPTEQPNEVVPYMAFKPAILSLITASDTRYYDYHLAEEQLFFQTITNESIPYKSNGKTVLERNPDLDAVWLELGATQVKNSQGSLSEAGELLDSLSLMEFFEQTLKRPLTNVEIAVVDGYSLFFCGTSAFKVSALWVYILKDKANALATTDFIKVANAKPIKILPYGLADLSYQVGQKLGSKILSPCKNVRTTNREIFLSNSIAEYVSQHCYFDLTHEELRQLWSDPQLPLELPDWKRMLIHKAGGFVYFESETKLVHGDKKFAAYFSSNQDACSISGTAFTVEGRNFVSARILHPTYLDILENGSLEQKQQLYDKVAVQLAEIFPDTDKDFFKNPKQLPLSDQEKKWISLYHLPPGTIKYYAATKAITFPLAEFSS